MRTYDLLGTPLLATSYAELTAVAHDLAQGPVPIAIDFTNTHIVTLRRASPKFRRITSVFDYFIPDGMPLVWCMNRRGAQLRDRVYGPTFMRFAIENSRPEVTHYFLGGSDECLMRLKARFSGRRIIGAHHGYFRGSESAAIIAEINALSPDLIWVGLGTPKQQAWIYRRKSHLRRGVILAVGFAFDVNAGTKPDAPALMQRLGLTWAFRIASEPRRLLGRYFRYNTLFLFYLIRDSLFGGRS